MLEDGRRRHAQETRHDRNLHRHELMPRDEGVHVGVLSHLDAVLVLLRSRTWRVDDNHQAGLVGRENDIAHPDTRGSPVLRVKTVEVTMTEAAAARWRAVAASVTSGRLEWTAGNLPGPPPLTHPASGGVSEGRGETSAQT